MSVVDGRAELSSPQPLHLATSQPYGELFADGSLHTEPAEFPATRNVHSNRRPQPGDCVVTGAAVRCLIVDDCESFREAARGVLERGGANVIGAVSNSAEALNYYTTLRPDVTLIDVRLGAECGFQVAQRLHLAGLPQPPPLILISTYAEQDLAEMIAARPVVGFVAKIDLSTEAIGNLLMTTSRRGPG